MQQMSLGQFARIVKRLLKTLPPKLLPYLANVTVDVEDEPDVETLHELGYSESEIADGESPLGLFVPFPVVDEGELDLADRRHRIIIYRWPHLECFEDRKELLREIRETVIHELAHHFGYTDRDMEDETTMDALIASAVRDDGRESDPEPDR